MLVNKSKVSGVIQTLNVCEDMRLLWVFYQGLKKNL